MEQDFIRQIEESIEIKVKKYNRPGNHLPYMLKCTKMPPEEGVLIWVCDEDKQHRVTGVMCHISRRGEMDKSPRYMSRQVATQEKEALLSEGWIPIQPQAPQVRITSSKDDETRN